MSPRRIATLAACALVALVALPAPRALAGIGDLYVTSDASNLVRQYAGTTGAFQTVFTTSFAASGQLGIHFGAANNRVLVGHWGGGVEEFDATSGAYIKTYNPGAGTCWAGIYAPTGGVYVGCWTTGDVREYDATTGAFIRVVTTINTPADMRLGPGGRLFIASYNGGIVMAVNAVSGAPMGIWVPPAPSQPNDIAILPGGQMLVTCMRTDSVYRFSPTFALLGAFASPGWINPHGIDISPSDGRIYIAEGAAGQVHVFDPVTFAELNPAYLSPAPGDKIVDLEFRPDPGPTPARRSSWGRIKRLYR